MLTKLRQAVNQDSGTPAAGRVEVDETSTGGPRSGSPGRGAAGKMPMAVAIEIDAHGWGRARSKVIPDGSMMPLREFTTTTSAAGSTVVSDGRPSYPDALRDYAHAPVNVSASGRPAHEALPTVRGPFAPAKRMIEGTYRGSGSAGRPQEYPDELVFRPNRHRSRSRGLPFMRLPQRAVRRDRATFRDLVHDPKPKPTVPSGEPEPHARPGTLDVTEELQP